MGAGVGEVAAKGVDGEGGVAVTSRKEGIGILSYSFIMPIALTLFTKLSVIRSLHKSIRF
jgi:hypothetical protein